MATTTWGRERSSLKAKDAGPMGWKDTLFSVKADVEEDKVGLIAAAMAYYGLFALVPAFSSVVLIYAWFSNPAEISQHINSLAKFIPPDLRSFLNTTLSSLGASAPSSLGFGAILTLVISLWSASKASKALIDALNFIYHEKEDRGIIKYTSLALGLTLLAVILTIIAMAVVVMLPALTTLLDLGGPIQTAVSSLSWIILLALFSLFLSMAYRFSPNHKNKRSGWMSWGAVVASVLWALTSGLFSWYAKEFANFNKTYGSLGAALALMTWFYLSSYVVLLGAEINVALEKRKEARALRVKEK